MPVRIVDVMIQGNVNASQEVLDLEINDGQANFRNLRKRGGNCQPLSSVVRPINQLVEVRDIGNNTPGLKIEAEVSEDVNLCLEGCTRNGNSGKNRKLKFIVYLL